MRRLKRGVRRGWSPPSLPSLRLAEGTGAEPPVRVRVAAQRPFTLGRTTSLSARTARIWTLVKKEVRQILRHDPSSIAVGMVMPVVLILLFGFGLTLDVKNVPIAVVLKDSSPGRSRTGFDVSSFSLIFACKS